MERHYFSGPLEIGRVSAFVAHVPPWWTLPGRYRFATKKDRYITQTERREESKEGVDKEEEDGGKGCNGEDKDGKWSEIRGETKRRGVLGGRGRNERICYRAHASIPAARRAPCHRARGMTFLPDYLLPWKILRSVPRLDLVRLAIRGHSVPSLFHFATATTLRRSFVRFPLSSEVPPYLSFVPNRRRTPFAHVNPWEWSNGLGSSREKGNVGDEEAKGRCDERRMSKGAKVVEPFLSFVILYPIFFATRYREPRWHLKSTISCFSLSLVAESFALLRTDRYTSVILAWKYRTAPSVLRTALPSPFVKHRSITNKYCRNFNEPQTARTAKGSVLIVAFMWPPISIVSRKNSFYSVQRSRTFDKVAAEIASAFAWVVPDDD